MPMMPSQAKAKAAQQQQQQQQQQQDEIVEPPGSRNQLPVVAAEGSSTVLAPVSAPPAAALAEEAPDLEHAVLNRVSRPGKGKGKRAPTAKAAKIEDPLKGDDTPPPTAQKKAAFAKLSLAPPKPEEVSEYFLDLAERMRNGDPDTRLEATSVLATMSENSEMAIRLRKYSLLDPVLGLLTSEGVSAAPQRIACKVLVNLLRVEDNQRCFLESPRSLPALRVAMDNAIVWATMAGEDQSTKDYMQILVYLTQLLATLARESREFRGLLRNARAVDLCVPVVSAADQNMPPRAVLAAASTVILCSPAEADRFGENEVAALRAIERFTVSADPLLRSQALDYFVSLALDPAKAVPMLHAGLLKHLYVLLEGIKVPSVSVQTEALRVLCLLCSSPGSDAIIKADAKNVEKYVKPLQKGKDEMLKSTAKMALDALHAKPAKK